MISRRIQELEPSITMAMDAKAKEFKRQGVQILNLSVGEPNFQTPDNIKRAAIRAIEKDFTYYTVPGGIIELREAVADKFRKDNHLHYDPSQVIIGTGAKQLLYNAFQVLCNPGDDVLLAIPTWNTFVEQAKLSGANPILIKLKPPFKLTAKHVQDAITPKTKVLLLNSPSNPTGMMIDVDELEKIAAIAVKNDIFVIVDEIYEKLVYTKKHVSIASFNKEIYQRTLTVNGASKSYAMTGWRLGYAAGPQKIIDAMKALQGQMIGSNSSITQWAGVEALTGDQGSIEKMKEAFAKRREFCIKELSQINKLSFIEPEGAFYFFISLEKVLNDQYPTATVWAEALLEKEKVAIVPGEAFFAPGYFRLSSAASDEDLKEAIQRIKRFIV